jgi:hypothetical protein
MTFISITIRGEEYGLVVELTAVVVFWYACQNLYWAI